MAKKKVAKKKAAKKLVKKVAKRKAPRRSSASTASASASATSLRPTNVQGSRVVHWEVHARDPGRQQAFFSDLFGWKIDSNNPQNYGMVPPAGPDSIGGGISSEGTPGVTFYVQVPDINAALAKAESLGAQTVMPRMDIGMIVMAQLRDPEGNVIGLVEGQ